MTVWIAIIMGIVQGLTEFLPISSSGHLSILQNIFGLAYTEDDHLLFEVMLHLGTLLAVLITYRRELKSMWKQSVDFITTNGDGGKDVYGRLVPGVRTVLLILIGTLPLIFILPFYSKIKILNGKLWFIGFSLLVTGGILYASDRIISGKKGPKSSSVSDAFVIGLGQAISVLPGLSRSGVTISLGIARGMKRNFAVKFSFLLSLPAVAGSFLLTLIDAIFSEVTWSFFPIYLLGMAISFITGLFGIRLVHYLVNKERFGGFAYYCGILGIIALIASIFF